AEFYPYYAAQSAIRPGSAARIGLIPPELAGRVRVLGNAAGCGALRYVTEEGADKSSLSIIRRTRYVELSAHPGFTTAYVDRMCFPETGEDGVDSRL
ncbi:ASKHA domain-containing protein, partial [uncultured Bilophila sp.]|uniref:ASKHA domain-containing protein n=1 Tax=uncultured Bilophila sp. TaxID=529385 RepID=UPI00262DC0D8